ncbi:MAG: hypothetical protein AB7F50_10100 [Fimbriimonadaceae bacterium]
MLTTSLPHVAEDPFTEVRIFLAAMYGTSEPDSQRWSTQEGGGETIVVNTDAHGIARLREDDNKIIRWTAAPVAESSYRRPPPSKYLQEDQARLLATELLTRLSRENWEAYEVRITRDRENEHGEFIRGSAMVYLRERGCPDFVAHRRGASVVFDSADGKPVAFHENDRVIAIRGDPQISEDEAESIANDYARRNLNVELQSPVTISKAYCASLIEIVEDFERGRRPIYRDSINAYWCLVARYSDPPGAWVAVRLTDGVVVWSALEP